MTCMAVVLSIRTPAAKASRIRVQDPAFPRGEEGPPGLAGGEPEDKLRRDREQRNNVQPVYRFAPSPSGELHLVHAYAALLGFKLCRELGGRFLVRMEDIDRSRCRPEYEALIKDELAWLGLSWEEPVRRQSEHFAEYRAALDRLAAKGLIYPSFASRAEIEAAIGRQAPRDPDRAPPPPG